LPFCFLPLITGKLRIETGGALLTSVTNAVHNSEDDVLRILVTPFWIEPPVVPSTEKAGALLVPIVALAY